MGRVHYRPLPLDEVVARATIVVVAEPQAAAFRLESFEVGSPGRNGEDCPPFQVRVDQWLVREALRGNLEVGAEIDVWPTDWRSQQRMHADYYAIGLSRSYAREIYECRSPNDEATILFLVRSDELMYAVPGSLEGTSHRVEIEKLLEAGSTLFGGIAG